MKKIYILLILLISTNSLDAKNSSFKWLNTLRYEAVRTYDEGLAAFKQDGKWGFIDTNETVIIPAKYEEIGDFSGGFARAKLNNKWGVIDKLGNAIFDFIYTELADFSDGYALAKDEVNSFYITTDKERLKLSNKLEYHDFHDGLARVKVKSDGDWGYINKKGRFIIEPRYQSASDFSGGYALVSRNDDTLFINTKGKRRTLPFGIPETDLKPLIFKEGIAKVRVGDIVRLVNQELGLLPMYAMDAGHFSEGFIAILDYNNQVAYANRDGQIAIQVDYDKVGNFSEGKAWVSKNEKYGYINQIGELVVDTMFSSATDFKNGIAYVSFEHRMGMIKMKEKSDLLPNLVLKSIVLNDANRNNQVEAEENFELAVTLHNNGDEALEEITISMLGKEEQDWFNFEHLDIRCHSLAANADTVIYFRGKAKLDILSEDIEFQFRGGADNLFTSTHEPFEFTTMGINACKPQLASYWIYKNDHTPLQPGDQANLKITVSNDGKDLAKAVKVDILWAKGMFGNTGALEIPILKPGETKEITTTFVLDTILDQNLTIVANLSEYTKKHNDIKYLNFEIGKMNSEINIQMSTPIIYQMQNQNQQLMAINSQGIVANKPTVKSSELLDNMKVVGTLNSNKYALVIGNEDYNSFRQTVSYEVDVDFAAQDATAFAAYASNYLGVPKQNVILLKNATYAQMNFNINKLMMMSKAKPNEVELYVYYAGHGQHDVDSKETYLIPVDVSISSPTAGLKLDKIYADLANCGSKRTMVFLDACYSGVGRGIVIKPKEALVKGNMLVLTASSSSQRSMPYIDKQHGMFTYFLLNTLKQTDGNISIKDLYNTVKDEVHKTSIWINNVEQTPELITGLGIQSDWTSWTLH